MYFIYRIHYLFVTEASKPGGMFAFGSSNLSSTSNSTFSLGTTAKKDEVVEEAKVEEKKETISDNKPLTSTLTNPLPLPKSNKWTCS